MLDIYCPVRHLATAIWFGHWERHSMLNLTSCFDETGESTDRIQRFNGIGGFLAPNQNWVNMCEPWRKQLQEFKLKKFSTKHIKKRHRETYRLPLLNLIDDLCGLPIVWIVSMDLVNALSPSDRKVFGEPYYRAFSHALFTSVTFGAKHELLPNPTSEEVIAIFDDKVRFKGRALKYFKEWKKVAPLAHRMPTDPIFRLNEGFPPLEAADLIVNVLKDEYERRLDRPGDEPQASYKKIFEIAEKRLETGVYGKFPFAFIEEEDIRGYL